MYIFDALSNASPTHLPTCTYLAFLCLFEQVVVFYTPLFPQFSLSEQLRDNDMKTSPAANLDRCAHTPKSLQVNRWL